jgi:hypothetical protein
MEQIATTTEEATRGISIIFKRLIKRVFPMNDAVSKIEAGTAPLK